MVDTVVIFTKLLRHVSFGRIGCWYRPIASTGAARALPLPAATELQWWLYAIGLYSWATADAGQPTLLATVHSVVPNRCGRAARVSAVCCHYQFVVLLRAALQITTQMGTRHAVRWSPHSLMMPNTKTPWHCIGPALVDGINGCHSAPISRRCSVPPVACCMCCSLRSIPAWRDGPHNSLVTDTCHLRGVARNSPM
jgi:endonuclease/exonuclease/phosphatase (EEP) superfamily protein YafD